MNILSDSLAVRFDEALDSLIIENPSDTEFELVRFRRETFADMTFDQCADFLGTRLLLLMPTMREHFKD